MISYHPGRDLLTDDAEALVNTVNCVGVMGKGIAKTFKAAFPHNFERYAKACNEGKVHPGRPFVTRNDTTYLLFVKPKFIVNATTKRHWRDPSQIEWIEENLISIKGFCEDYDVKSIAIPPMGCGNGGLLWCKVNPLFMKILTPLTGVDIRIYAEDTINGQNRSPHSHGQDQP